MKVFIRIAVFLIVFCVFLTPCYALGKKKHKGEGYVGKLPSISKYFQYKQKSSKPNPESGMTLEPLNKENLKKGPMDDAVFVDIIVKKKNPSKYYDDVLKIIPVAEDLRRITKERGLDIQKYISGVNTFDLYVTKLQRDYKDKPESMTESYNLLQEVNYRAKVLGNLKYESNFYSKYKPVLEEEYTEEYLNKHDEILVKELDKTIYIMQKETNEAQFGENKENNE